MYSVTILDIDAFLKSPNRFYHLTSPAPSPSFIKPFFFLSVIQRSIHDFILVLLAALPTLTVGMIFSIRSAQQNMVSSLKLLCSEYGTPKQDASRVLPRWGTSSAIAYLLFQLSLMSTVCTCGLSTNLFQLAKRFLELCQVRNSPRVRRPIIPSAWSEPNNPWKMWFITIQVVL